MSYISRSFSCLLILISAIVMGQDSLSLEDFKAFSYSFDIIEDEFVGPGSVPLKAALAESHITLLGNNNRSVLEAEFTNTLIVELNRNEYKTMVLEVGPGAGTVIDKLMKPSSTTASNLKALNQQYGFEVAGRQVTPIPDFRSIEASMYLQNTAENEWALISIGIDHWTGYKLLIDELYANVPETDKQVHLELYQKSQSKVDNLLKALEGQRGEDLLKLTTSIQASLEYDEFLDKMSTIPGNKPLIEALEFSIDYWRMYGTKEFYQKNALTSERDKKLLSKHLKDRQFDFGKEKLFVNMWRNHLSKGRTAIGFYGVGNMLMELAGYQGSKSVSIAIARRYYEEDNSVKDNIESVYFKRNSFNQLIPLGQKEEWILVDLRPFNENYFYGPYQLTTAMQQLIQGYDFVVIPKIDQQGTINY